MMVSLLFCIFAATAYLLADDKASESAGKTIFLAGKCNTCHSIESMQIAKKISSSKAPDLSNEGSKHNAEWIAKWLKKEETLNGKKHLGTFNGKDEDLKTLSEWLASLKK
jgi:mono/diheme cytochrome c family protein